MRWGSQLEVPFEKGELVQTWIGGEPVIGEVDRVGQDYVLLSWGLRDEREHHFAPWWSGLTLVRPAISGYPYERKLSSSAWSLLWILCFPHRLRRRLCRFRR